MRHMQSSAQGREGQRLTYCGAARRVRLGGRALRAAVLPVAHRARSAAAQGSAITAVSVLPYRWIMLVQNDHCHVDLTLQRLP